MPERVLIRRRQRAGDFPPVDVLRIAPYRATRAARPAVEYCIKNTNLMNIDIERIILEVQMHPVIWDTNFDLYKSKDARQAAWMDICTNLVEHFDKMTSGKKKSVVAFFQKKWKSVRDYYIRDKKWEIETGGSVKKRKKKSYFNLMAFLSDIKDPKQVNSTSNLTSSDLLAFKDDKYPQKDESSDYASSCGRSGSKAPPAVSSPVLTCTEEVSSQLTVLRRWARKIENNNDEDPNRHFLLSLLPEMTRMTERQNFKFRLEIMKILNQIKYQVAD